MSRPVHGRIYELRLRNPWPDEDHPYVGKTETTIHRRVHGPNGHTSARSMAKDPWKARILPGPAGYRLLETVYATGDVAEDDRALRRAEAFWIDRLRPKYNDVRPVRPFADEVQPAKRRPAKRRAARQSKPIPARAYWCFLVMAAFTAAAARLIAGMQLPWPAAPWIGAPVSGVLLGWFFFWRIHRAVRKLLR
jgi:hypothetical protein